MLERAGSSYKKLHQFRRRVEGLLCLLLARLGRAHLLSECRLIEPKLASGCPFSLFVRVTVRFPDNRPESSSFLSLCYVLECYVLESGRLGILPDRVSNNSSEILRPPRTMLEIGGDHAVLLAGNTYCPYCRC
jgi:hypothetical protein